MKRIPACALVAVASVLSACGGGDDEGVTPQSATQAADFKAYAGNWATCGQDGDTVSTLHQVAITQVTADTFHYAWLETEHASTDCSGPGALNYQEQGDAIAQGKTTTVDGVEVQWVSVRVTRDGQVVDEQQVVALTPDGLRIGDPAATEANGTLHLFPNPFKLAEPVAPAPAPAPAPVPAPPPPQPVPAPPPPPPAPAPSVL